MSVEVTRLASGLSVVTDTHAASGNGRAWRVGRRRQPRRAAGRARHFAPPRAHGLQGHEAAQRAADRRRRSRRSAAISTPRPASRRRRYFARVLKADVPLALDVLADILSEPTFDPEELRREQNVIVQEIGATEDAPDDLVFDRLQETAFPGQPVGRSILGTPETVRSFNSAKLRAYLARNYRAPDMLVAAAGAVEHRKIVDEVEKRFSAFIGPAGAGAGAGEISAAGSRVETRDLEQVHIAMALQGVPVARPGTLQPAGLHQRARRRDVVAAVSGGARDPRALLLDPCLPHAVFRHRPVRTLRGHGRSRRT